MSHDWDQVYKEGKTMFRLPKECITGHVEGGVLMKIMLVIVALCVIGNNMFFGGFSQARPLRC